MSVRREELEEIASRYHLSGNIPDMFIENLCQEHTRDWIRNMLRPPGSVLEMGYGDGIITASLAEDGHELHVVEGAPSLAELVSRRFAGRVHVHSALFEEFEPGRSFDHVIASHVLEHVDAPVPMLGRIRSWLKPDGQLLAIVPNRESLHRQLAVVMGLQPRLDSLSPRDHLVGHQRVYSFDSLEEDLRAAGFRVEERKGFFLKVLPNSMMLQFSPELIRALNVVGDRLPPGLLANIGVTARVVTR